MRRSCAWLALAIAVCFLVVGFFGVSYAVPADLPAVVVAKFHHLSGQKKFRKAIKLVLPEKRQEYITSDHRAWMIDGLCFQSAEEKTKYRTKDMAIVVFYLDTRKMQKLVVKHKMMTEDDSWVGYARIIMGWVIKYDLEQAADAKHDTSVRIKALLHFKIRRVAQLKLIKGRWYIVKMGQ